MPQNKHKYRVNVYLGKDLYEDLQKTAEYMGISLSTMCKIVLSTGYELSKSFENKTKEGLNGNQ